MLRILLFCRANVRTQNLLALTASYEDVNSDPGK